MDLESYIDGPGDLLTNLDPPMTSLKILCLKLLQFSSLQIPIAGNHCRNGAFSLSLVKLIGASYLHSVMADAGHSLGGA